MSRRAQCFCLLAALCQRGSTSASALWSPPPLRSTAPAAVLWRQAASLRSARTGARCFCLACPLAFAPELALLRQEAALAEYRQCRKGLAPLKPAPHRDRAGQASSYALLAAGFCSCGSGIASKPQAISLCNLIIKAKLLANCFEFPHNP